MKQLQLISENTNSYAITIEPGVISIIGQLLRNSHPDTRRIYLITDTNVKKMHSEALLTAFKNSEFSTDVYAIAPGEKSKCMKTVELIWNHLLNCNCRRRDLIVAFGGGVVTDLAGFIASTYMRGIPYVNIPSTLLAQLDASIGSKVAVNHKHGKNLIGTFYHPDAVYIDTDLLNTLTMDEIRNGLSEAIKVSIISSESFFSSIENNISSILNGDFSPLLKIIHLAVMNKIRLILPDLHEKDLKRALNFGHSIGHAIETAASYENIRHGEAVAIGMATAIRISYHKGFCSKSFANRVLKLIENTGLPTFGNSNAIPEIWHALSIIKKVRNGRFLEVLPTGFGTYIFFNEIKKDYVWKFMCEG